MIGAGMRLSYTLTKDKAGDVQDNQEVPFCLEHLSTHFSIWQPNLVNLFLQ